MKASLTFFLLFSLSAAKLISKQRKCAPNFTTTTVAATHTHNLLSEKARQPTTDECVCVCVFRDFVCHVELKVGADFGYRLCTFGTVVTTVMVKYATIL